jgi:hypothetical protein
MVEDPLQLECGWYRWCFLMVALAMFCKHFHPSKPMASDGY